ncbi:MAG: hypothetical protein WD000_05370 [Thermodesulfobacteriota bacterium]
MPELNNLTKHVSNYVTIYPYKEIEDENWPAYQDEHGNWVGYDEGWREVGFKCPYPTVARLTQIRDLTQDLTVEDKSFLISSAAIPRRLPDFSFTISFRT